MTTIRTFAYAGYAYNGIFTVQAPRGVCYGDVCVTSIRTEVVQMVLPWEAMRVTEVLFDIRIENGEAQARETSRPGRSVSFARPAKAHATLQDGEGRLIAFSFLKLAGVEEYQLTVTCNAAPADVPRGIVPEIELRLWLLFKTFGGVEEIGAEGLKYQTSVSGVACYLRDSRKFAGLREDHTLLSFLDTGRQGAVVAYLQETGLLAALCDVGLISTPQRLALEACADDAEFAYTDAARISPFFQAREPEVVTLDDEPDLVEVTDGMIVHGDLPGDDLTAEEPAPVSVTPRRGPRPKTQSIARRNPRTGEVVVEEFERTSPVNGD